MVAMGQTTTALNRKDDDLLAIACLAGEPTRALSRSSQEAQRRTILTRTVELDVIPRLLRARGLGRSETAPLIASPVTAAHVEQLVTASLGLVEAATSGFVAAMRDQGFRAEALYLELLAPAANRLGELWVEDLCDFTEVTIGLTRLHQAMRLLSPAFLGSTFSGQLGGPRALLVPLPGEQHTFGLSMVFEFFRRAGWNAWSGPIATTGELATMVRRDWVDVVGFSLSCDERLETARAEIRAVRLASRNPGLAVMVGGPPFVSQPGLAAALGADGTARDGLQAVGEAHALLQRDKERR